ncbi:hypothetical protein [Aromatoleum toluclasticum]|nr:hypothetical protein [Aromatoleum toluclasticum]
MTTNPFGESLNGHSNCWMRVSSHQAGAHYIQFVIDDSDEQLGVRLKPP